MLLTINQIDDLLKIIDRNHVIAMGQELGPDYLTKNDLELLRNSGVKLESLYTPANDSIFTSFHFGMLAESLEAAKMQSLTYLQLKEYVKKGRYIPLTLKEWATMQAIKTQAFNDLKSLNGRIFKDVNQVLIDSSLKGQKEFLKQELIQGKLDHLTVRQIANEIARKTGDWSRDFDRIIAYNDHMAIEEGKAAMIQRNSGVDDPIVYKIPFIGACPKCIELYTTRGYRSAPRLFKLSELRANGTNIGRKKNEWIATLGPIHPYCRCALKYKQDGYEWNKKTKKLESPLKKPDEKPRRAPIQIWVGDKEYHV